ncbi:hypothetical protein Q8F55_002566 [Vanrija albida]|uniref:Uncharacterized protein n=1 Tax=Vanrija albida TaxID=181172 RepID=A0ABR3QAS2_9TREE
MDHPVPQLIEPRNDPDTPDTTASDPLNALDLVMSEGDDVFASSYSYRYSHWLNRPGRVISITSSLPMADDSDVDPEGFDAFSDTESCVAIRDSFFRAIQYVPPSDNSLHPTPPLNIRKRSQVSLVHRSLSRRSSFPQSPITPPLKAFAPLPMVESPPRVAGPRGPRALPVPPQRSMSVTRRPLPPLPSGSAHAKHGHSRSEPPVQRPFRPLPPIPMVQQRPRSPAAKSPSPPVPGPSSAPAQPQSAVPPAVYTPPPRPRPQNPPPIVSLESSDEDMLSDMSDDDLDEFFGPRKPKKAAGELAPGGHPRKAAYVLGIVEEEEPSDVPSKVIAVLGTRERAAALLGSPSLDRTSPKKQKRDVRDYKVLRFGDATKTRNKSSKPPFEISAPIPLRGFYFDESFGEMRPSPNAEAERREATAPIDSVLPPDPVKPSSSSARITPSERWDITSGSGSASVKGPFTDTWDELFYHPRHAPAPSALKYDGLTPKPRHVPSASWGGEVKEFKPLAPPRIGSIFSESFKLNLKNLNQSSSTLSRTPPESPARGAATLSGTSDEDEARPKRPKTRPPALQLGESSLATFPGTSATTASVGVNAGGSPTDTTSAPSFPRLPPSERIQFATPNTSFEDLSLPTAEPLLRPSTPEAGPRKADRLRAAFQRSMAAIGGSGQSPPSDTAKSPPPPPPPTASLKSPIRLVSNPRGLPVYGTSASAELRENEGVSWFEPETPNTSPGAHAVAPSWTTAWRRVAKPLVR